MNQGDVDDLELMASRAVETVRRALPLFRAGPPLFGPGNGPVDVPVLYDGLAVDIVHYDPLRRAPSPKGRPVHCHGSEPVRDAARVVDEALGEAVVLGGAEYRGPERAWVVPVAWRSMIIMHVRVSWDGEGILPDPGLQARLRREAVSGARW